MVRYADMKRLAPARAKESAAMRDTVYLTAAARQRGCHLVPVPRVPITAAYEQRCR